MPRVQPNKDQLRAREQYSDLLADSFAKIHKDQSIFYVGSTNGNAAFSGRRITSQKATVGAGIAAMTASRGDILLIDPFHAETITSSLVPVAGSFIKGLKVGNKRPKISINGATDLLSLSAANVDVSGLELAIVTTDAATAFVDISGANCRVSDIYAADCSAAASVNVVDTITLASGANNTVIENISFRNTTTAVNSFVSIEAAVANLTISNCFFFGDVATAGMIDGATATQIYFNNLRIGVVGTSKPAATLDSNPTGFVSNSMFAGTSTTLATNAALGTGVRMFNVLLLEETDGSKQGVQIPAVDAD